MWGKDICLTQSPCPLYSARFSLTIDRDRPGRTRRPASNVSPSRPLVARTHHNSGLEEARKAASNLAEFESILPCAGADHKIDMGVRVTQLAYEPNESRLRVMTAGLAVS